MRRLDPDVKIRCALNPRLYKTIVGRGSLDSLEQSRHPRNCSRHSNVNPAGVTLTPAGISMKLMRATFIAGAALAIFSSIASGQTSRGLATDFRQIAASDSAFFDA